MVRPRIQCYRALPAEEPRWLAGPAGSRLDDEPVWLLAEVAGDFITQREPEAPVNERTEERVVYTESSTSRKRSASASTLSIPATGTR